MKRRGQLAGILALMGVIGTAFCATATAQSGGGNNGGGGGGNNGGGGGGGLNRHGGNFNIFWDTPQPIGGKTPRVVGSVNVSTYVTTLNVDIRIVNLNLPDNMPLIVTVYTNDYFTGAPWFPQIAGILSVQGQKATLPSTTIWTTPSGFLPVVTNVVVMEPDGTVVASGRP